jgi:uncharacterized protein GlcG (DUF336 family)
MLAKLSIPLFGCCFILFGLLFRSREPQEGQIVIRGIVVNHDGKPIQNVEVFAYRSVSRGSSAVGRTISDDKGQYEIKISKGQPISLLRFQGGDYYPGWDENLSGSHDHVICKILTLRGQELGALDQLQLVLAMRHFSEIDSTTSEELRERLAAHNPSIKLLQQNALVHPSFTILAKDLGFEATVQRSSSAHEGGLTGDEVVKILDQAETAAKNAESLLRVDLNGRKLNARMHIVVVDRSGRVIGERSMTDAWAGSNSIARGKAFTATAFSSNQNALSTRSLGSFTQPGGPLWNIGKSNQPEAIIEFPGGIPLYKGSDLVGGIGVSGDTVDQDEAVAIAGGKGYEPPKSIRIDSVTGGKVPYTR